jgi:SNF2 family DNA or RNA helicase
LFYLFKFLNLLCASCALIPFVFLKDGKLRIIWKPFDTLPEINEALIGLSRYERPMLPLKTAEKKAGSSKAKKGGMIFASGRSVIDLLASAFMGEWVKRNYFAYKSAAQSGGREYRELLEVFFQGKALTVTSPALRSLPVNIDRWLSVLHIGFDDYKYRFTVKGSRSSGDEVDDFTLSMDLLLETEKGIEAVPLSRIAKKPQEKTAAVTPAKLSDSIGALRAPTALSNYLPEIRDLLSQPKVQLSEVRLVSFLDEASPLLSRLGIEVILPKALSRELRPRLVLKADGSEKGKGSLVSYLALDNLLDWKWQVAIGDRVMDLDEFEKLVKQKRALVRFKDGFVRMDPEELAQLLKKAHAGDAPGPQDFLKAHFSGDSVLSFDAEGIINKLFEERRFPVPKNLTAELRPYQERGYNWVCSLLMAGFGCILADDMGLGKTVQSIAALLRLKEEGLLGNDCLVIAPAALLENWERELHRFAPSLKVSRYHGIHRSLDRNEPNTSGAKKSGTKKSAEVFLTTYQTAVRDAAKLEKEPFSLLIVDEAHLMKNADTRGAKTVKRLRSNYRLALSGTPVENRLEDLRSLFDFILPGFLGTPEDFKKTWRVPIEVMRKKETAGALQKITSPFLLRRLKTDKSIITDLPDKVTVNEYALLEKEQAALYESVVSEVMQKSEHIDPKERPALVLALLTSLKQICDHPRVFDKQSPAVSKLSGKALLLITLLQEILDNGEKVLIFSQYVETLDCLSRIITAELGEGVLTYHGGMGQKLRSETINIFQTDPACRILLVSLKAGGLGLNLTAASRVIHYDLWYNPAVENQATDRAFRIGQKRNVFVHRFITKSSFEEKIDEMISAKRELADMTVSSGESWLARMSHEELKALFER